VKSEEYDSEGLKIRRTNKIIAGILIAAAVAGHNNNITEHTIEEIETGHSEIATEFLSEGENLMDNGDVIQASEKLYKAAEEAVNSLAETYAPDVCEEAMKKGRWTVRLLEKAIDALASEFRDEDVERYWEAAWFLHVEGFHETRLDMNSAKRRLKYVKKLVELNEEHNPQAPRSGAI